MRIGRELSRQLGHMSKPESQRRSRSVKSSPEQGLTPFGEIGGSLLWGGCHYPHREHRYGSVFDVMHLKPHPQWSEDRLEKKNVYVDPRGAQADLQSLPLPLAYAETEADNVVKAELKRLAGSAEITS